MRNHTGLASANTLGIFVGLLVGKPFGIVLFCFLAVKAGVSRLPTGVSWKQIAGVGLLGGIGFTMSIFIILLAFSDPVLVQSSKITVLISSVLAGIAGYLLLRRS